MNEQAIVLETIEYYENHPRSVRNEEGFNEPQCRYWGKDDEDHTIHCAVARCMTKNGQRHARSCESYSAEEFIYERGDKVFYQRYQGHTESFWTGLQSLHDFKAYWIETNPRAPSRKLSIAGTTYVARIFDDGEEILNAYRG